jgi:hypothetical protein
MQPCPPTGKGLMMRIRWMTCSCAILLAMVSLAVWAQEGAPPATGTAPLRLLLVDATKTFASTARVGALAGAIRTTGAFDLQVCFSDQEDAYEDPMPAVNSRPEGTFDLVLFVPRGLDDGTAMSIWVITNILPGTNAAGWTTVRLLSGLVDKVFAGLASAVDPSQDLWPALLASLYQAEGWLQ